MPITILFLALLGAQPIAATVHGVVRDAHGQPLAASEVGVACPDEVLRLKTAPDGTFSVAVAGGVRCVVTVSADGFETRRIAVDVPLRAALELRLSIRSFEEQIVVSAARGLERSAFELAQGVARVARTDLHARSYALITQALREEAGVLAQQTTSAQGSPIVRGFTGQRNVYLIDGVRYNTAAWRDGPSQYLAWVPAASVDRIEIVRGPASALYGSDALGATISLLGAPQILSGTPHATGYGGVTFASASTLRGGDIAVSAARQSLSVRLGATIAEASDLRPGGGVDSHAAVTRFLGLPSSVVGDRLPNTGFRQHGQTAAVSVRVGATGVLRASYMHASQTGAHRYDQELGGNGRYRSEFGPQRLDFAIVRLTTGRTGWFDDVSAGWSLNRQADGRLEQVRPNARIDRQSTTTTAFGYQIQGTRLLAARAQTVVGAEFYDERLAGERELIERSGAVSRARPDIPDGTTYGSLGVYWQQEVDLIPDRLHLRGGLRYGRFVFGTRPDSALGVTAEQIVTNDATFNVGTVWKITERLNATVSVGRGFRAANAFDFGGLGLSGGAGFEITPDVARALDGQRGSTDGSTAVATGDAVEPLRPEQLYAFEAGLRWHSRRVGASLTAFDLESRDAIERRTVIFTRDVVGEDISGFAIVRQDAAGRAYVAADARPIVTRVNISRARIRGFEADAALQIGSAWRGRVWGSLASGRELATGGALRRMPPAAVGAALRWHARNAGVWVEGVVQGAFRQTRLTDADYGDARIGARRTAASIAAFFSGTATDMLFVQDGRLVQTGETLAEVQARVLVSGAEMFRSTPGFAVITVRGGVPLTRHADLIVIGENLTDRNYRLHGSGVDEPGVNIQARLRFRF